MAHRLLIHPSARPGAAEPDVAAALAAYLRLLAGSQPDGRFLEIRAISRDRVQRRFVAAARPRLAMARIGEFAEHGDVYLGVALRTSERFGGKQAIDGSHLAFIECDTPAAADTIERFEHQPTMVIVSGTPGHLHIYWQLRHRYPNEQVERANRKLAHHLGGDLGSIDIARVLRPPGTRNYKHQPPTAVELRSHHPAARYTLAELTAGLPDPRPHSAHRAAVRRVPLSDPVDVRLRAIPSADYVRALTGRSPDRTGKICCPFHPDDTPSLQLYPGGTFYCFGCQVGGSIYDFAAALWLSGARAGRGLRGGEFTSIRERLTALFDPPPRP